MSRVEFNIKRQFKQQALKCIIVVKNLDYWLIGLIF